MVQLKSKHDLDVHIQHEILKLENSQHAIRILGAHGDTVHIHTWTIGSVDGPRPNPPTPEELQKEFDYQRQFVADEVGWKEKVRQAVALLT